MNEESLHSIGDLARRTGLPVKTIRFHSDRGLVPPTGRSPVGLRLTMPGVSDDLDGLLQRIAWDTVTAYPLSGVQAPKGRN